MKVLFAYLSCMLTASQAAAAFEIHGSSNSYTETGGQWTTMGSNDIDNSGGLGSDGYIFYGAFPSNNDSAGNQPYSTHVASLPGYVTQHAAASSSVRVAYGFSSYGTIDDPVNGGDSPGGIANLPHDEASSGTSHEIIFFTVADIPANEVVRVGILGGVEANADGRWDPTTITLSDGTNSLSVTDLPSNPGGSNTGWVFFDLSSPGTYTLSATQRLSESGGVSIGGLTFDSGPAPGEPPSPTSAFGSGQTIGIDFGETAPSSASGFNHYSDITIADGATEYFADTLRDTGNTELPGVGFSISNHSGQDTGRAIVTNGSEGAFLMDEPAIYSDCIISNSTSANRLDSGAYLTLTFTGLNDNLVYNLSAGWDNDNNNFDATWIADGESASTNPAGGNGFVTLTDLSTDGDGTLEIQVLSRTLHLTIGALQLTAVGMTNSDGSLNFPLETPEGGYSFPNAFPNLTFAEIASLESLPGHPQKLFVVETRGMIWMIPDITATTPTKVLILDRSSVFTNRYLNGMGGIAFHPDFYNNGYFYVTYPSDNEGWTRVSRFTVATPNSPELVDNSSEQILIQENFHRSHGFNRLLFGPDGYLYIPVGDGKQDSHFARDNNRLTQTIDEGFWSAIHRIDVDKKPGNYEPQNRIGNDADGNWIIPTDDNGLAHYSVPADNPFIDQNFSDGRGVGSAFGKSTVPTEVRTEMYAIGFRNPWKIGFVPGTSDLWVADVMGSLKERILIMPKGGNAGWSFYSGTGDVERLQTTFNITPPTGVQYVQPVVEYYVTDSNSGSRNKSIIGGEFYQAPAIPSLTGAFLMCDYNRGDIWAVHRDDHSAFQMVDPVLQSSDPDRYALDDIGIEETTLGGVFAFGTYEATVELLGVQTGITAMLPNPSTGEMLLADSDDNIIRKVVYDSGDFDSQLPQSIASTGAFSDIENFVLNPEMLPYEVNQSFWSDGATKSRYLNMVDAVGPIQYSRDDFWRFPAGTVTMKHFEMDLDRDNPGTDIRRIETRFLVKTEESFYGMTYLWNEDGTQASLVSEDGANLELQVTEGGIIRTQSWRLPSRAECSQCHTSNNEVMLGFNTRQLNHDGELKGSSGNFLTLLESAGYLSPIDADPSSLPAYSRPNDIAINLEKRVKDYLAVNCAYCHYDGNTLVPNSWRSESHLTIEETSLLHGEAIGFQVVDETDRLVIPGDTANSIILSRAAATNGYGRMPPVGTNLVDPEGVALLTDWINNYANAKPAFGLSNNSRSVTENSSVDTNLGSSVSALDPDYPDANRGELTYSISGGNTEGYFNIVPSTGQIFLAQAALDYEVATTHQLTVRAHDGFAANPGEAFTSVTIQVDDLLNDDSQGDGIADEWAVDWFGMSSIDPFLDSDGDGAVELFEYWANSSPLDPREAGVVLEPSGVDSTPGDEGFYFEWVIRTDLAMGTDYLVQGSPDLSFHDLEFSTELILESTTPLDEVVSKVRVKVPTNSPRYFLRLRSPN